MRLHPTRNVSVNDCGAVKVMEVINWTSQYELCIVSNKIKANPRSGSNLGSGPARSV